MVHYISKIRKLNEKITHLKLKHSLDVNEPEEEYSVSFIIFHLLKGTIRLKTALKIDGKNQYEEGSFVEVFEHQLGHPYLKTNPKIKDDDEIENLPLY